MSDARLIVWQLSDDKRGHERQCEGLANALAEICPLELSILPVADLSWHDCWRPERIRQRLGTPRANLLIGAGHRTHWALAALRWRLPARSICLMRPSLPYRCFDLSIVPRHDGVAESPRVMISEGPLNPMHSAQEKKPNTGLILLGGPSAHHHWDNASIAAQIRQVTTDDPARRWVVCDSRRSPADLLSSLTPLQDLAPGIEIESISHQQTSPAWLPKTLAETPVVWVSEDSAAMIYEALSAGAQVGLFHVPAKQRDRISAIGEDLVTRGLAIWPDSPALSAKKLPDTTLREATRCAQAVMSRWPDLSSS